MKILFAHFSIIILFIFGLFLTVYADEIYLHNGDKITGKIKQEQQDSVSIETEAMGLITVDRHSISRILKAEDATQQVDGRESVEWQREVSLGYDYATGNTRESQLSGSFLINRNNNHVDEWTIKGDIYYSSVNRKMNAQKWYNMARYARSFGSMKKWYNFYRLEADHDRFADIDYRLVPAAGIGYWFYDISGLKLLGEAAAGFQRTAYRTNIKDENEWVFIPRLFMEKKLFTNTSIKQNLFCYFPFEGFSKYRLYSETSLDIAMNHALSLRLSLIDDYNAEPPTSTKKNDLRLVSSLVCSF